MAKIFTKLNLADIVVSSGGKSFRKLSTEEQKPVWNGTTLYGTTWYIPAGWSASKNLFGGNIPHNITYNGVTSAQRYLYIGSLRNSGGDILWTADSIATIAWTGSATTYNLTPSDSFTMTFTTEFDARDVHTDENLINWFKQYGVYQSG